MKQLPLVLVLSICGALFLWNVRSYDVAHAAEAGQDLRVAGRAFGARTALASRSDSNSVGGEGDARAHPGTSAAAEELPEGTRVDVSGARVRETAPDGEEADPAAESSTEPQGLERIVERFPSGVRSKEGTCVDGVNHGRWTTWWENGQPMSEGAYDHGRREGPWTYWYENGEVMERGSYKEDLPDGPWTSKHPNGVVRLTVTYANGLKDGPLHEWSEDGSLRVQGNFVAGEPNGPWLESHPNGAPRSETHYVNGVRHGEHSAWYTDGQLREQGLYRAGLREGRWLFYDPQGNSLPLRSGYYELGARKRP